MLGATLEHDGVSDANEGIESEPNKESTRLDSFRGNGKDDRRERTWNEQRGMLKCYKWNYCDWFESGDSSDVRKQNPESLASESRWEWFVNHVRVIPESHTSDSRTTHKWSLNILHWWFSNHLRVITESHVIQTSESLCTNAGSRLVGQRKFSQFPHIQRVGC